MRAHREVTCCILIVLVCRLTATAQNSSSGDYQWPTENYYQPVLPLPPSLGESYNHDSTATGNVLRGWASMIHANGNWWLDVSQASVLFETADALRQFNHRQWIAFRVANRQRIAIDRQQRLESLRAKNVGASLARCVTEYKLSAHQIDPTSGAITWPEALRAEAYGNTRQRLENLFHQRAAGRAANDGSAREILQQVEELRRQIRRDLGTLPFADIIAAQKFLCGLKLEASGATPMIAGGHVTPPLRQLAEVTPTKR